MLWQTLKVSHNHTWLSTVARNKTKIRFLSHSKFYTTAIVQMYISKDLYLPNLK